MEKMTYVSALTYVLDNCDLPTEIAEKLSNLRGQQGKRSGGSGSRKPTAQQTANKDMKSRILVFLANGGKHTITELVKLVDWGDGVEMSVNRCSALVRQLKENGQVVREEINRKAYFSAASVADTAE